MAQITEKQKEEIKVIISDHTLIEIENFKDSDSLFNDLDFDDLDHVELVMDLEKHFDITIDDYEWEKVKTVEQVYDTVNNKL